MSKTQNPSRGVYRRGNIYWLAMQRNGKRDFISLETPDFTTAVTRAEEMRSNPGLQPGAPLETEIDRFLAHKKKQNEFTRFSSESKGYILKAFAKWLGEGSTAASVTLQDREMARRRRARGGQSLRQARAQRFRR